jgi:hypothetical protein
MRRTGDSIQSPSFMRCSRRVLDGHQAEYCEIIEMIQSRNDRASSGVAVAAYLVSRSLLAFWPISVSSSDAHPKIRDKNFA